MSLPSTSASWLRAIAAALQASGIEPAPVFAAAGLHWPRDADPLNRLPVAATRGLWQAAVAATQEPAFGLAVARQVTPSTFRTLGHAVLASPTLRDAYRCIVRYYRVFTDVAEPTLAVHADEEHFVIHVRADQPAPADESLDAFCAVFAGLARMLVGRDARPLRVALTRPPPVDSTPFARAFGCPLQFGQPAARLVFAASLLERPVHGADLALSQATQAVLAADHARLLQADIVVRIRHFLLPRLAAGDPGEEAAAQALWLSRRTLQRRLAEAGTSYRQVRDGLRQERAEALLAETRRSLADIAFLLGFSEQSAFTRAFRRWTGVSPQRWRQGERSPAPAE